MRRSSPNDFLLPIKSAAAPCPDSAPETTGYRLCHGEGDRLPGIVIDIYGPIAVVITDGGRRAHLAFRGGFSAQSLRR